MYKAAVMSYTRLLTQCWLTHGLLHRIGLFCQMNLPGVLIYPVIASADDSINLLSYPWDKDLVLRVWLTAIQRIVLNN